MHHIFLNTIIFTVFHRICFAFFAPASLHFGTCKMETHLFFNLFICSLFRNRNFCQVSIVINSFLKIVDFSTQNSIIYCMINVNKRLRLLSQSLKGYELYQISPPMTQQMNNSLFLNIQEIFTKLHTWTRIQKEANTRKI